MGTIVGVVLSQLPAPVIRAVGRLRAALQERFAERLREVVLFGSHARGEPHDEGDVDVLVVIRGLTEAERSEVFDLTYDANAAEREVWVGLSAWVYSEEQAAKLRSREQRLFRDIDRQGIQL